METIRGLPEDASWLGIEERIHFLAALERVSEEVRRGEVVPHEDVRNLLNEWLTAKLISNDKKFFVAGTSEIGRFGFGGFRGPFFG